MRPIPFAILALALPVLGAGTYQGGLCIGPDRDVGQDGSGFNPLDDCPRYEGT